MLFVVIAGDGGSDEINESVRLGFFFQAEDGIRDLVRSRGLGDVYKRQLWSGGAARPSALAAPANL